MMEISLSLAGEAESGVVFTVSALRYSVCSGNREISKTLSRSVA